MGYKPPKQDGVELIERGFRVINDGTDYALRLPTGERLKAHEIAHVGIFKYRAIELAYWIERDRDTEGAIRQLKREIKTDRRHRQVGHRQRPRKRQTGNDPLGLIGKEFTTPGKQGF